ncbi:hypothetical protein OWV82_012050, partial [Melia azedarach]
WLSYFLVSWYNWHFIIFASGFFFNKPIPWNSEVFRRNIRLSWVINFDFNFDSPVWLDIIIFSTKKMLGQICKHYLQILQLLLSAFTDILFSFILFFLFLSFFVERK